MIRINLLPDLRQAKLRDQHRRHLAVSIGVLVCSAVVVVLIVLEALIQVQKIQITSENNQINDRQGQLVNTANLSAALETQQTLNALPSLYQQRVYYTNLFTVLSSLAPSDVTLSSLQDSGSGSVQISGTARSYTSVALFVKALTTGTTKTQSTTGGQSPFETVTIGSLSSGQNGLVSYGLTATINPEVLK